MPRRVPGRNAGQHVHSEVHRLVAATKSSATSPRLANASPAKTATAKASPAKTATKSAAAKTTAKAAAAKAAEDVPESDEESKEATESRAEEESETTRAGGFVVSDSEDDSPVQQVVTAGATADPVKDYLKQIGKVARSRRAGGDPPADRAPYAEHKRSRTRPRARCAGTWNWSSRGRRPRTTSRGEPASRVSCQAVHLTRHSLLDLIPEATSA